MADSITGYIGALKVEMYDKNKTYRQTLDRRGLGIKYIITANSAKTGYDVAIYTHALWKWEMNSSGGGKQKYSISINGTEALTKEESKTLPMKGENITDPSMIDDPKNGQTWYYVGTANNITPINNAITISGYCLDFTDGINNSGTAFGVYMGAWYVNSGTSDPLFFHKFYSCSGSEPASISVSDIPLETAPVIGSLVNTNPRDTNTTSVSASTNSISWSFTKSGGSAITNTYYRYQITGTTWSGWTNLGAVTSGTLSGLTPRITYTIEVYASNGAGNSSTLSLTVRTKSDAPTLTLTASSISLEQATFNWTSNYALSSLKYKNGSNGTEYSSSMASDNKSGSFTVTGLSPSAAYTVYITGTESSDSVTNTTSSTITTLGIATVSVGDFIHNNGNIPVTASIPSYPASPAISTSLSIDVGGYAITKSVSNGNNNISFTEAQWDVIYKKYGKNNSLTATFTMKTTGTTTYSATTVSVTCKLTGIQKTSYVGDSSNKPRRAQIWIGDSKGVPRRAVVWVGSSNKTPYRTI